MEPDANEIHVETDRARGGSTPHVVRWMLGIGLVAAIVLLSAIWMFGAATQGDGEDEASVTAMMAEEREGSDTDGVILDEADRMDAPDTPAALEESPAAE